MQRLPAVLKAINSGVKRITRTTPSKSINSKKVNIEEVVYKRPVGLNEIVLPPLVQVRYLFAPGEDEGGEKRRATSYMEF